jgi:RNA recognition motif-containing protein
LRPKIRSAEQEVPERARPPPRARPRSDPVAPSTNIFINYIPAHFTEADLRALCAQFGTILCAKIMVNLDTGQSKCFGFVRYSNLAEAQTAIKNLNGLQIGPKRLLAKYAESKEKEEKVSSRIYVKRLPMSVTLNDVLGLFAEFGTVLDVTPQTFDIPDAVFWRCIIRYSACHEAVQAVRQMNNHVLSACAKPIHVNFVDESRLSGGKSLPELPKVKETVLDEVDEKRWLPAFLLE